MMSGQVWLSMKCGCWIDKTGELHRQGQCSHGTSSNRCYVLWAARTQYVSSETGYKHLRVGDEQCA